MAKPKMVVSLLTTTEYLKVMSGDELRRHRKVIKRSRPAVRRREISFRPQVDQPRREEGEPPKSVV